MLAAMAMRIDNLSTSVLDLIDDETLIKVLSRRAVAALPVSLDPEIDDSRAQVAREKRILRLLERVSRYSG